MLIAGVAMALVAFAISLWLALGRWRGPEAIAAWVMH
jgi:hypothetical protein